MNEGDQNRGEKLLEELEVAAELAPIIERNMLPQRITQKIGEKIIYLLPFAAGSFIYIAAADLIPQLKEEKEFKKIIYFVVFLTGIFLMILFKLILR